MSKLLKNRTLIQHIVAKECYFKSILIVWQKRGIMKTLSFRIEDYQNSLINELVEVSGVKRSSVVRELLERGLEDMKHILVQK